MVSQDLEMIKKYVIDRCDLPKDFNINDYRFFQGTPTKVLHGGKRYEFPVRLTRALMAELRTFLPESAIKLV